MSVKFFNELNFQKQKALVEALIFAAEEQISPKSIIEAITNYNESESPDALQIEDNVELDLKLEVATIENIVQEINKDLQESLRPYRIVYFAGGFQFSTNSEYGKLIADFYKSKAKRRLSQATLETLAIIAYKQPISKPSIEQIRGVGSSEVVKSLVEKNLVKIVGRSEALGKPLLYGTTDEFLKVFGLKNLDNMPKLRELDEIANMETLGSSQEHIIFKVSQEDIEFIKENKIELQDIDINQVSLN